MAVSETYVVQFLLQNTLGSQPATVWAEKDFGYRTKVRSVEVALDIVPSRAGERIFLTLSSEGQRTFIAEPPDLGLLTPSYESEEKRNLAFLLRELARNVVKSCAQPNQELPEEEVRETVFRRLLFGEAAEGAAALPEGANHV
jgi:hypothetical protein